MQRVNQLIEAERWPALHDLAVAHLKTDPDNHWWLAQQASALYEMRQYEESLKIIQKALTIMPDCPLVLWHLAGALDACSREDEALAVCRRIIKIAGDESKESCHESKEWNASLVDDCERRIRWVSPTVWQVCRACGGSGIDPESHHRYTSGGRDDRSCRKCGGSGVIEGEV